MRILFYQHGNFLDALNRFAEGGSETYRDQRLSVEFVAGLAPAHEVTVLTATVERQDARPRPGLRVIGFLRGDLTRDRVAGIMAEVRPERLILGGPHPEMLRAARRAGVPTLPCLADIFEAKTFRQRLWGARTRWRMRGGHIGAVANHSLNASRSLVQAVGLPSARVVPWDWTRLTPEATAKTAPGTTSGTPLRLFFAGALRAEKGLGDVIEALALLKTRGVAASLSVAGPGETAPWADMAAGLGVECNMLGLVPNAQVRGLMREHDAVLVPSRHTYPEGLPNTIYEALAARSPLITSDHPAFAGRLPEDEACLVFRAADPGALADAVARLVAEPGLYARLSEHAPQALEALYVGLEWPDLITRFLDDPRGETGWIAPNSLMGLGLVS